MSIIVHVVHNGEDLGYEAVQHIGGANQVVQVWANVSRSS